MAERSKLLYIIVHDEKWNPSEVSDDALTRSFRYTRTVLQSTLQLFGCKQRHAFKISKRVFPMLKNDHVTIPSGRQQERERCISDAGTGCIGGSHIEERQVVQGSTVHIEERQVVQGSTVVLNDVCKEGLFGNKYSSTVILAREKFLDLLCDALSEYRYMGPNQRGDLLLACRVRERKASMTILLCGTSGCGKSTLSSLLASRLGITTVVSTDSIRHMMRSFVDEKENPLLWASTYHAGEFLDPEAVAEAKAKKQSKIMEGIPLKVAVDNFSKVAQSLSSVTFPEVSNSGQDVKGKDIILNEANSEEPGIIVKPKTMAVQGYKAQSEMVIDSLDRLITAWEQKCESVIVEGVHLSLNFVMGLMKKHPSIIPFMIYIANEEKHLERFAVRAKYMTLDPAKNKYVKYIRNIRTIQDYLCKRADKYLVPKVNNTNVDRSIAAIHATIFGCLRRRERGEPLYDQGTNTVKVIDEEYKNQWVANSLGSKGMLQLIKRRGSSRQLVALVNTDGSVAKAWSFESGDIGKLSSTSGNIHSGSILSIENPTVGGSAVEKLEPVNLQFGNFSLTAWEPDLGGPSHNGSIDGLSVKGGLSDSGSPHGSSSCSSTPRQGEGAEKELINESAASGSDEEPEEIPDVETDDDLDFDNKPFEEHELEGSIDDESIRSEEEDDEFVAVDEHDNEYCSINTGGVIMGMEERIRIMHQDEVHVPANVNNCNGNVEHGLSVNAVHEKENYFKGRWSMDMVQLMKR